MKKSSLAILATVSAIASVNVNAAVSGSICSGASVAKAGEQVGDTTVTNEYVKQVFDTKCSANVAMAYNQNALNFAIGAGSAKGKNRFSGNTGGGAVSAAGTCSTATGCAISDATTAAKASLDSLT